MRLGSSPRFGRCDNLRCGVQGSWHITDLLRDLNSTIPVLSKPCVVPRTLVCADFVAQPQVMRNRHETQRQTAGHSIWHGWAVDSYQRWRQTPMSRRDAQDMRNLRLLMRFRLDPDSNCVDVGAS